MHRFFTLPENITGEDVALRGPDVVHIRTVLRLRCGDRIHVLDGRGSRYTVRLTQVGKKEITGKIESREAVLSESPIEIHMGQALIKGNKFDMILRKSVELGIFSMAPVRTERCVVKMLRTEAVKKIVRWETIARSAARQSGRTVIPRVEPHILSVDSFCREKEDIDLKLIFWEGEEKRRLNHLETPHPLRHIAFLTGPEGGFTEAEIHTAEKYGFLPLSLGPRILRAETAPIAVLALLQHRWGDL
ncbi:MAG: 16S rRNA (uracil(1498)-N(3))-methyltransferase [Nitrospinaceae bacterium]